jgi:hypothetical protein
VVLRKERELSTNYGRNNLHIENKFKKCALNHFTVNKDMVPFAFRTSILGKPFPV